MKTGILLKTSLIHSLHELTQKQCTFQQIVDELFYYSYEDYNMVFELDQINVPQETYQRIPVFNNNYCVAIIMIWGIDNTTAIHDHKNYDGRIKVLKGELTEVSYRENDNFIEYDGVGIAHENQIFPEEYGGIHSIVNNYEGISYSLHVYRTSQMDLEGVRIFDTENRKIGWLNKNATSCSWNLPVQAFEKIEKI